MYFRDFLVFTCDLNVSLSVSPVRASVRKKRKTTYNFTIQQMFDIEIDDTHEIILIESVKMLCVLKNTALNETIHEKSVRASVGISIDLF